MSLTSDAVFAIRTLRRRPAFAAAAIATIALGIGAATAIYSVVDGVLFRPLPYREPGRIIAVWQTYPQWLKEPILKSSWDLITLSLPEFADWRATQTSFSSVGVFNSQTVMLGGTETPEMVTLTRASATLLDVLGQQPALGRYFLADEDVVGGAHVTLLSYDAWQARYHGDPHVLGQAVRFSDQPYTIIGVLPPRLSLTRGGGSSLATSPFWIPVGQDSSDAQKRGNHSYRALGRLKPGVTLSAARAETERILRGDEPPDKRGVRLDEWQADLTRDVRKPLLVLLGAVGLLLLISCVNVAILLLGEAAAREREIASRIALGAGRGRIVMQLLNESLALAGVGAIIGMALAWAGTRALVAFAPPRIPGMADVGIDLRVLAFTVIATAGTGILFGLAPALVLGRASPSQVLRATTGQSVGGRGALQRGMVAAELALSLMLLVGAALLSRSLNRLTEVDPGFRADHLLSVRLAMPRAQYSDSTAARDFYRTAADRLVAIPGVTGATAISNGPFTGSNSSTSIEIEGRPHGPNDPLIEVQQRTVASKFFETMGMPVLAGRTFMGEDNTGGTLVAVISASMARRDWPNEPALGKRFKFQGSWREVIGVVGDTKYARLSTADQATVYVPLSQRANSGMTLLVRTSVEPTSVIPAVRATLRDVAPTAAFLSADRMTDLITRSFAEERYRTMLISLFGVLAAVLAAVGMYGVTSRAVSRRTREMGIRLALGASATNVTGLVVRYTLSGVVMGVLAGVAGAALASHALAPFLFAIEPTDRVAYVGSVALLGAVAIVASWLPARRAARVQPAVVLRSE